MKIRILAIVCFIALQGNLIMAQSGTMTDPRDGKIYKTVKIGNQTWMAENLAYAPELTFTFNHKIPNDRLNSGILNNGKEFREDNYDTYAFCYKDSLSNYAKYGALYPWEAALKGCPVGWHLPSKTEFDTLLFTIGGNRRDAYKALIANGNSGFEGLLGGRLYYFSAMHPYFKGVGHVGFFWTSTETTKAPLERTVLYAVLVKSINRLTISNNFYSTNASYSVRCIKD